MNTTAPSSGGFNSTIVFKTPLLARALGLKARSDAREKIGYLVYTRYPIVARAWPSGCRVRARAKVSCIQGYLVHKVYFGILNLTFQNII